MSKVIDVDFKIENIEGYAVEEVKILRKDGQVVLNPKGEAETERVPLTLKSILLTLIPVFPAKENMVDMWDLGLKVKKSEGETKFDSEETSLIRDVVQQNSFPNPNPQAGKETLERYFPYIIAQTLKYIDDLPGVGK